MPPTRKKTARAGGAFGALNALSQSGALASINGNSVQVTAPSDDYVEPLGDEAASLQESGSPARTPQVAAVPAQAADRTPSEIGSTEAGEGEAAPALVDSSQPSVPETEPLESADTSMGVAPSEAQQVSAHPLVAPTAAVEAPGGLTEDVEADKPAQGPEEAAPGLSFSSPQTQAAEPAEEVGASTAEPLPAASPVALRSEALPDFQSAPGYMQPRQSVALPPVLAKKVSGLPPAYLLLAGSYRAAKSAGPGRSTRTKRNIRLHIEVADAMMRQLLADKRQLGIKDLKPSHYVDAALTFGRSAKVKDLISEANRFRDQHLGEENSLDAPNHFSVAGENDQWLDEMMDEMMLARANGLHGFMINVIIEAFIQELARTVD